MILYLHGFRSAPQSAKAQSLHKRLTDKGLGERFVCPLLSHVPADAIAQARMLLAAHPAITTVVGSSLGGFYATWLAERHGLKAVLVNPAVVAPLSLATLVGRHENLYTGEPFEFTETHVAQLRGLEAPVITKPEHYWLLAETGDEVLDYRHAITRYAGARQTVLEGGDHSFTRWDDYLDGIIAFAGL